MPDIINLPTRTFALFLLAYYPLRSLIVSIFTTWFTLHSKFGKARRVYRVPFLRDQFWKEIKGAPQTVAADLIIFISVQGLGMFRNHPTTASSFMLALVIAFCWAEFWYYWMHRVIHEKRFFFIHRQHHVGQVNHPLTYLSFSFIERLLQTGGNVIMFAALSHVLPVAFSGFVVYAFFTLIADVIAHLNVEIFPRGYANSFFGKLFFSPSYHAMHHARFRGHYGQFTPWFDHLFGTYYADYPEIFERAVSGVGIPKLDFKGEKQHA